MRGPVISLNDTLTRAIHTTVRRWAYDNNVECDYFDLNTPQDRTANMRWWWAGDKLKYEFLSEPGSSVDGRCRQAQIYGAQESNL